MRTGSPNKLSRAAWPARVATWAALGWLMLMAAGACGADALVSKEYQIKAAFLNNFTKFVEWPASSFSSPGEPLRIGVFGKNPFGGKLLETIQGHTVNGRRVVLQAVESADDAKSVHLLFIPATEARQTGELLAKLKGAAVLTVGESAGFVAAGGMIHFLVEEDRMRFEINMDSAEEAHLKISAQIQKLAKTIRRKP